MTDELFPVFPESILVWRRIQSTKFIKPNKQPQSSSILQNMCSFSTKFFEKYDIRLEHVRSDCGRYKDEDANVEFQEPGDTLGLLMKDTMTFLTFFFELF